MNSEDQIPYLVIYWRWHYMCECIAETALNKEVGIKYYWF